MTQRWFFVSKHALQAVHPRIGSPASWISSVSKPSVSRALSTRFRSIAVFPSLRALPLKAITFNLFTTSIANDILIESSQ